MDKRRNNMTEKEQFNSINADIRLIKDLRLLYDKLNRDSSMKIARTLREY